MYLKQGLGCKTTNTGPKKTSIWPPDGKIVACNGTKVPHGGGLILNYVA